MTRTRSLWWMVCTVAVLAVVLVLGLAGPADARGNGGTLSISGTVTAEGGAALSNVLVNAYDSDGYWVGQCYTDAAGAYTITDLLPGSYKMRTYNWAVYIDEWYDNVACMADPAGSTFTPVELVADNVTGKDFELAVGRTISGTVIGEGTTPLAYVEISIYNGSGTYLSYTYAETDGTYTLDGIFPGSYIIRTYQTLGYLDEWFDNIPVWQNNTGVGATFIDVTAGDATNKDFDLALGQTISGTVTAEGGGALENVEIDAYSPDGTSARYTWTEADGTYTLSGLVPGSYRIGTSNGLGYVNEWYDNVPRPYNWEGVGATLIDVSGGNATGKDFELGTGQTLSGTVTAVGGTPLENVTVEVYLPNWGWIDSDTTGPDGTYTIDTIVPGTYKVRTINDQGYVDEWWNDLPVVANDQQDATPVDLTAADATADFELAAGIVISGTVTEEQGGEPIEDADVNLYDADGDYITDTYSDSDGHYELTGLLPGTYKMRVRDDEGTCLAEWYNNKPDWQYDSEDADLVDATLGNVTGLDFALVPGMSISGTVTGAGAGPLEDVWVSVESHDYDDVGSGAYTAADGTFTIEGLPPIPYLLKTDNDQGYLDEWYDNVIYQGNWWGEGATPVDLGAGDAAGKDFELAVGSSISGTVTNGGGDPLSVDIDVYDEDGNYIADAWSSNTDGTYTVGGLLPGTYKVLTYNWSGYLDEWYNDKPEWQYEFEDADWIDTTGGNATGVDFSLGLGQTLSGTVTGEGEGPLSDVSVEVVSQDGEWLGSYWTWTDGKYTIGGLPPTNVLVNTWNEEGYVDEWYDNVPLQGDWDGLTATPVDLSGGGVTDVDFELAQGLTISGTVTEEGGTPIYDIEVDVYTTDGDYLKYTWTNKDGEYTLGGLLPGVYTVATWNYRDGYMDEWYDDLSYFDYEATDADPVDITGGSVTGIDFELGLAPLPTITSLVPANGPLGGGNEVIVNGTGFYRVDDVFFGHEYVRDYDVLSDTQLVVIAPPHAAGTVNVKVEALGGDTVNTPADDYTYTTQYTSIRGTDRYDTALKISRAAFPEALPAGSGLVLAPGDTFQEALCGGPLAAAYGGPVLLTPRSGVSNAVLAEIKRLQPEYVICIGLSDLIKNKVQTALGATGTASVIRGTSVYHMSYLVAKALSTKLGGLDWATAIITRGDMFPDAIGVSPLACANLWPILLTGSTNSLSIYANMAMTQTGITEAIKVGTYAKLPATVTGVVNLSGADRYATNVNVAEWAVDGEYLCFWHLGIATGDKFPDALAAGQYLAQYGGVLLLSPLTGPVPTVIRAEITAHVDEVEYVTFFACIEPVIGTVKGLLP